MTNAWSAGLARKRVDAPGFVEALAAADIAVTGNSLTITDELLEKLPNLKLIASSAPGWT